MEAKGKSQWPLCAPDPAQGLADVAQLIPARPDSLRAHFKYFLTPHIKFHRDILHSSEKLYLHEIITAL